jgi:hypothetical protein
MASFIAKACVGVGTKVELVGTVGDDAAGDAVVVDLARAGVGHAALLRVPADASAADGPAASPGTRLDARDLDLGLRYLADFRVLVVAEPLPADAEAVVIEAAAYSGAVLIAVAGGGAAVGPALADVATVLEAPDAAPVPFAEMVGRYAAGLDAGLEPAAAFTAAAQGAGWEPAG